MCPCTYPGLSIREGDDTAEPDARDTLRSRAIKSALGSASALGWAIAQIQRGPSDAPGRTAVGPSALRFTQGNLSAGPGARPSVSVGVKPIE